MANNQQNLGVLITNLGKLQNQGDGLIRNAMNAKTQQIVLKQAIEKLIQHTRGLNTVNNTIKAITNQVNTATDVQKEYIKQIKDELDKAPDNNAVQQTIQQVDAIINQGQQPGQGGPGGQPGARPAQPQRDAAGAGVDQRPPFKTGGYTYGATKNRRKNRRKRTKKSRKKGSYKKSKKSKKYN
jgi:uncharacterized phage infection (PIP) family protein YhgE